MLYTDCPGGKTDAVARHVSFAQIKPTCLLSSEQNPPVYDCTLKFSDRILIHNHRQFGLYVRRSRCLHPVVRGWHMVVVGVLLYLFIRDRRFFSIFGPCV